MSQLSIVSVGAFTPLGIDARQTALMLRASKCFPRPTPFVDEEGIAIGSVRSWRFPDTLTGAARMIALGQPALIELLENLPHAAQLEPHKPVVLLLTLPEPWDGEPEEMTKLGDVLGALAKAAGISLDDRSTAIRLGSAGFAALLARAATFSRDVPVIVGAIDSFHDRSRLETLDKNFRVLSSRGGNGFIPSEGAAFIMVTPPAKNRSAGVPPLATIRFVSTAEEETLYPVLAKALTKITSDPRLPRPVPWVLSDATGEHHRTREWTYVRMRNFDVFHHRPERTWREHLHRQMGDAGAANAALATVYATMGFTMGFARAKSALVVAASEGAARSIVFLESAE